MESSATSKTVDCRAGKQRGVDASRSTGGVGSVACNTTVAVDAGTAELDGRNQPRPLQKCRTRSCDTVGIFIAPKRKAFETQEAFAASPTTRKTADEGIGNDRRDWLAL